MAIKPHLYRYMLWEFIAAMDSGEYDNLDIEEVKCHAAAGTIGAFIVDRFSGYDFSVFEPQHWVEVGEAWANLANAVDARRKFGVENKGITLLMAYALQSMQALEYEEKKSTGRRLA